jgi:hypothetical protein
MMKAKLAVFALGALVVTGNGANAQYRTSGQMHVRHLSRIFGHTYGYAPREAMPGSIFGQAQGHTTREPPPGAIFGPEQPRLDLQ